MIEWQHGTQSASDHTLSLIEIKHREGSFFALEFIIVATTESGVFSISQDLKCAAQKACESSA